MGLKVIVEEEKIEETIRNTKDSFTCDFTKVFKRLYPEIWATTILIFLYNLRKQRIDLTKHIIQNWFEFALVFATIIVAVSGCIF
jgi:hypothetical protein